MARLPDGNSANGYSYDVYSYADFNLSAATDFNILTFPGLPFQAMAQFPSSVASIRINGPTSFGSAPVISPGAGFYSFSGAVAAGTTFPVCYGKFDVSDSPFDNVAPSYSANKARVISQAWRLVYTGPAAQCTGIVTVTPQTIGFEPAEPFNKQLGRITYVAADGTAGATATDCAVDPLFVQAMNFIIPSANKESIQIRPETSPCGLVRRNASSLDWNYADIRSQATLLVRNPTLTVGKSNLTAYLASSFSQAAAGGSTAVFGTVDYQDYQWDHTCISLTGVTGSFRFETVTCFEFLAQQSSIVYELSTASPPLDTKMLQNVETAAHGKLAMPSAVRGM
jgi:hypothetical protein